MLILDQLIFSHLTTQKPLGIAIHGCKSKRRLHFLAQEFITQSIKRTEHRIHDLFNKILIDHPKSKEVVEDLLRAREQDFVGQLEEEQCQEKLYI